MPVAATKYKVPDDFAHQVCTAQLPVCPIGAEIAISKFFNFVSSLLETPAKTSKIQSKRRPPLSEHYPFLRPLSQFAGVRFAQHHQRSVGGLGERSGLGASAAFRKSPSFLVL